MLLIERLRQLEKEPARLAEEVHACWFRRRRSDGWTRGRADHSHKSSPYFKPLQEFTCHELEREVRLALNDLRGIILATEMLYVASPFALPMRASEAAHMLHALRRNRRFVVTAARLIHAGWRDINRSLATNASDGRLGLPFDALRATDKRITIANVQADIEAVANLLAGSERRDQVVHSCPLSCIVAPARFVACTRGAA
jgi:hypothetical protein